MDLESENLKFIEAFARQLGVNTPKVDEDSLARLELPDGYVFCLKTPKGGDLVFSSTKKLSDVKIHALLTGLSKTCGGAGFNLTLDGQERPTVRTPADQVEVFLGAIDEHKALGS